jgi:hypothetical protein
MTERRIRVLLIDDDRHNHIITRTLLSEIGPDRFELEWASSYAAGRSELHKGAHDVYLVDYQLGAGNGLELIREAMAAGCEAPPDTPDQRPIRHAGGPLPLGRRDDFSGPPGPEGRLPSPRPFPDRRAHRNTPAREVRPGRRLPQLQGDQPHGPRIRSAAAPGHAESRQGLPALLLQSPPRSGGQGNPCGRDVSPGGFSCSRGPGPRRPEGALDSGRGPGGPPGRFYGGSLRRGVVSPLP